jgi:chromosome segregation ATPase
VVGFAQEREEAAADMEMATRSIDEKVELEAMLAELKATVASQQKEIVDRELHISSLDQQLKVTNRTLDDLQLELSRSTSAVQVAEHTWTLKRAKQRLKTANPEDESNVPQIATRNTLTMVGRMGVMFGGTSKDDTLNG